MFSFNGENIRERVRITIHNLMEFLLNQQDDQSKNLLLISSVLQTLCFEGVSILAFQPISHHLWIIYNASSQWLSHFLLRNFQYLKVFLNELTDIQTYLVGAEFSSTQEEYTNKLRWSDTGTSRWTIWQFWTTDFLVSKSLIFISIMN